MTKAVPHRGYQSYCSTKNNTIATPNTIYVIGAILNSIATINSIIIYAVNRP